MVLVQIKRLHGKPCVPWRAASSLAQYKGRGVGPVGRHPWRHDLPRPTCRCCIGFACIGNEHQPVRSRPWRRLALSNSTSVIHVATQRSSFPIRLSSACRSAGVRSDSTTDRPSAQESRRPTNLHCHPEERRRHPPSGTSARLPRRRLRCGAAPRPAPARSTCGARPSGLAPSRTVRCAGARGKQPECRPGSWETGVDGRAHRPPASPGFAGSDLVLNKRIGDS